ncbi:MAG: hypothetical protein EBV89_12200 [Betaproteobacteria bacterium]|nr:hypothetical protein [Betaproteobacteria bacterium]
MEGLRVGDAVMALCGHGGFAQQALVEAAKAVRIPAGVAMDMAASFTMVYWAWQLTNFQQLRVAVLGAKQCLHEIPFVKVRTKA